jgi:hypothetical protein
VKEQAIEVEGEVRDVQENDTLKAGFQHSHAATSHEEMVQNIRISRTQFLTPSANPFRSETGFQ